MNSEPLVSVIIPTYNHGAFVGEAVRSALRQTYRNVEVIVVDNFSADDTMDVLAGIQDPRLQVYQFNNRGVIAAGRNFGVSKSKGEVLAFLDSDDCWFPEKIEQQLRYLDDPAVSCVACDFVPVGDVRYYKHHLFFAPGATYRDYTYDEIAGLNAVMTSSTIVRASDFKNLGGFDERDDFRFIEDWELWLRLTHGRVVRVLAARLIEYRILRKKTRDMRDVCFRTLKVLQHHHELGYLSGAALRSASGSCYLLIARACLEVGDPSSLRYFRQGLVHAKGLRNCFRALGGIALSLTPCSWRRALLEAYYRVPLGNHS